MANALLDALPDEPVLQSNSLATVTRNWVVLRNARGSGNSLISIDRVVSARRATTTYPGLLVIAVGLFLVAAAAYTSKQGDGAAVPLAVIGLVFVVFYFGSRRAAAVFTLQNETVETAAGSLREVNRLMKAVEKARAGSFG